VATPSWRPARPQPERPTAQPELERLTEQPQAARGYGPPGAGGREDCGADGGAGSSREPQHAGILGRGRAVTAADGGVDVARGTCNGGGDGRAQDMGRGGPQGEPSASPDERPQFTRQVSAPEEEGWREVARSEWDSLRIPQGYPTDTSRIPQ